MLMLKRVNPGQTHTKKQFFIFSVKRSFCPPAVQKVILPILEERTLCVPAQYPLEGLPEVIVEDGVYDRVEAGIAVANPKEEFKQGVWDAASFRAHCFQRIREEEREPADHKHSHDHSQHEGEPLLPVHHGLAAGHGRPLNLR